ncbi:5'-methylthioadenosine/adenosylhomocysteine nucleosidase [Clostridium sp. MSJ-8]|uniref:5'-methylthioadenosine/adenosylhomocysteine nucleosidase n=1 Tax=Clostridium sp. MSJ-8 TaxID=2841510 RepID=UPI001C0F06A6|nr:5'-methylthioadenosine/adenosylhomocysteine nucleosidase [Clostridium sp. MSJ-8]MBU5488134.1 5'-methylthioadenosine/adenosylhomocysteine nucleosidase [Clostridium sp. MSJ-8]
MKLGIIAAMSEELDLLLQDMQLTNKQNIANITFNEGTLFGKDVVAVVCGIGKVNAAICTQILITSFDVDKVINVGVAGGVKKDIYPGDIVVSDSLVEHDMDCSVFGDAIGQIPRMDTFDFKADTSLISLAKDACSKLENVKSYIGRIVSGDQFIASPEKVQYLEKQFNASACEMEGASIAHVCYSNNVPFVIIRAISDNANNGAHMDFEKFTPIAVKNSTAIIKEMVSNM